jgi:hypothetical protein
MKSSRRARRRLVAPAPAALAPVTVRLAEPADSAAVARVAGRDSQPLPPPPQLVAERGGEIEAVLSLSSGAAVADPFRPTAELVELLRYQAHTASRGRAGTGRGRSPRPAALGFGLARGIA